MDKSKAQRLTSDRVLRSVKASGRWPERSPRECKKVHKIIQDQRTPQGISSRKSVSRAQGKRPTPCMLGQGRSSARVMKGRWEGPPPEEDPAAVTTQLTSSLFPEPGTITIYSRGFPETQNPAPIHTCVYVCVYVCMDTCTYLCVTTPDDKDDHRAPPT